MSRSIARVDSDVALGEVAGPEAGFALAFAADLETNQDLAVIESSL